MIAQVQRQPIQPIDIAPEIGPKLNAIVLKALAKDPDQRYQSAEEFRLALQRGGTSSRFTPGLASLLKTATLALAVCAIAETFGLEKMPLQKPVAPAIEEAPAPQMKTATATRPPKRRKTAAVSALNSETKVTAASGGEPSVELDAPAVRPTRCRRHPSSLSVGRPWNRSRSRPSSLSLCRRQASAATLRTGQERVLEQAQSVQDEKIPTVGLTARS